MPTESARLCSEHFVDGKRRERNPMPMLRLGYHIKVCSELSGVNFPLTKRGKFIRSDIVIGSRHLVKHELQVAAKKVRC